MPRGRPKKIHVAEVEDEKGSYRTCQAGRTGP